VFRDHLASLVHLSRSTRARSEVGNRGEDPFPALVRLPLRRVFIVLLVFLLFLFLRLRRHSRAPTDRLPRLALRRCRRRRRGGDVAAPLRPDLAGLRRLRCGCRLSAPLEAGRRLGRPSPPLPVETGRHWNWCLRWRNRTPALEAGRKLPRRSLPPPSGVGRHRRRRFRGRSHAAALQRRGCGHGRRLLSAALEAGWKLPRPSLSLASEVGRHRRRSLRRRDGAAALQHGGRRFGRRNARLLRRRGDDGPSAPSVERRLRSRRGRRDRLPLRNSLDGGRWLRGSRRTGDGSPGDRLF
jgi:hypothetical protein